MANKGFIKDWNGNQILPITRGELVLDKDGQPAFHSKDFLVDVNNNLPGLMSWEDKALLQGLTSGGSTSVGNLLQRITYINNGFKVNNFTANFYTEDDEGNLTATPIILQGIKNQIDVNLYKEDSGSNYVNVGLHKIHKFDTETATSATIAGLIKSITYDEYGRLTAVSTGNLTEAELTGVIITNATLTGCTSDTTAANDNSIANVGYVKSVISSVEKTALGALQFKGTINDSDSISTILKEEYWNCYYKVTDEFEILSEDLYSNSGSVGNVWTKVGDTLIVYPVDPKTKETKIVHIPSGDEMETTISIQQDNKAPIDDLQNMIGPVTFQFPEFYTIETPEYNKVSISIPVVSDKSPGILSVDDYKAFKTYSENYSVTYKSNFTGTEKGIYTAGTMYVGTTPFTVHGKNDTYNIKVANGSGQGEDAVLNPQLQLDQNDTKLTSITYKGINGIKITKPNDVDDVIQFEAANVVKEQDVPQPNNPRTKEYLKINNGHEFEVVLGGIDENGEVIDGLTDYSQFNAFVERVAMMFSDTFTYSLKGADNENEYRYGNTKLKGAVYLSTI